MKLWHSYYRQIDIQGWASQKMGRLSRLNQPPLYSSFWILFNDKLRKDQSRLLSVNPNIFIPYGQDLMFSYLLPIAKKDVR